MSHALISIYVNLGKPYRIFLIFRLLAADLPEWRQLPLPAPVVKLFSTIHWPCVRGETMHRDIRGYFYISLIAIGGLLLAGTGCSFVKVRQGWVLSSGWSLEFHRSPFSASCEKQCAAICETGGNSVGNADCANPPQEISRPSTVPEPAEPAPTLHKVEAGDLPEANESSSLMNLLKRRGRLGVCATCGKLGRFKEPQPAEPSTIPVTAKFHPVPAAPVFCPQPNAVTSTKAVDYQTPAEKKKSSPSKKPPLPPQPGNTTPLEVIPPPPPSVRHNKSEQAPRELSDPPEPPDWVFTAPENRTEKEMEAQSQPSRSSGSATRR
jgi:hypothetical protein